MATLSGTTHGDRLAGHGDDSYTLIGLQGNDTYTLRLFQVDIHQPDRDTIACFGDPAQTGAQNAPHEVDLGTLTLKHVAASHLSDADVLFA